MQIERKTGISNERQTDRQIDLQQGRKRQRQTEAEIQKYKIALSWLVSPYHASLLASRRLVFFLSLSCLAMSCNCLVVWLSKEDRRQGKEDKRKTLGRRQVKGIGAKARAKWDKTRQDNATRHNTTADKRTQHSPRLYVHNTSKIDRQIPNKIVCYR